MKTPESFLRTATAHKRVGYVGADNGSCSALILLLGWCALAPVVIVLEVLGHSPSLYSGSESRCISTSLSPSFATSLPSTGPSSTRARHVEQNHPQ